MNDLHPIPAETASAAQTAEETVSSAPVSEEDVSAVSLPEDSTPQEAVSAEAALTEPVSENTSSAEENLSLQIAPPAGALMVAPKKEPYIGSVRFFKNMILLVLLTAIVIPTTISVIQYRQLRGAETTTAQLRQQVSDLEASLQETLSNQTGETAGISSSESSSAEEDPAEPFPGETPSYEDLYPDFYAEEPFIGDQRTEGMIYLTFDDGPSDRTPEILQILREEDVKATFFVIGNNTEQGRQWMRDIVADGHTIAMHTYSHNYSKIYASVEDYLADMYQIFTLIKEATGVTPTLFRFPGGSINGYNYGIYQELTSEMLRRGFMPCDWNVSSQDAAGGTASATELTNNVVIQSASVSRGVVLMHDAESKRTTVAALPSMIQQLREQGFAFDRLTPEVKPVLYGYRD